MKTLQRRLIVSDFDGTLLTSNHQILPEVRKAIQEYVDCGGIFAVCTGRMLRSILPQVRALNLKGIVVAYQGTVIADIETGTLIKKGGIPYQDAAAICRTMEEMGCTFNVYSDESLYTNIPKSNRSLQLYENITGVKAQFIEKKLSTFVEQQKLFCQKITSLVLPKDRESQFQAIRESLADEFDVTCSADCLIEVSPMSDNKGEALKYLANYYGVPVRETVAIGDNLNDLSMIKASGLGVAVGNAVEELKLSADHVTVSNDEGAVAIIINKFGFA